jgi:23S rRNA (pseudouridine1915-N3)-methyltransferase
VLKIRIIAIGKDKETWVTQAAQHYLKLLSKYARVELIAAPSPKLSPSLTPAQIRDKEGEALLKAGSDAFRIALCVGGKGHDSEAFASLLERLHTQSGGSLEFFVGGAHGLSDDLTASANLTLSLSALTFPHQLVRIILLEQLYRAFSILHNTDYHK